MEEVKFCSKSDEAIIKKEWLSSGLQFEEFLIKKREVEFGLTDWERSQRQKANWRKKRWKYLKGIRRFHRSTDGKRFHRNLGRWLATRDTGTIIRLWFQSKEREKEERGLTTRKVVENLELLVALNSGLTHALIEKRYLSGSVSEEVEYNLFLEEYLRVMNEVYEWVQGKRDGIDVDFVIAVVHPREWAKIFDSEVNESFIDGIEDEGGYVGWFVKMKESCKVKEEVEDGSQGDQEAS